MPAISSIHAQEILDSRGNPTIEVNIELDDGAKGRASVPSGASTGSHEAIELRDQDKHKYLGKSVDLAVQNVNEKIAGFLKSIDPMNQQEIDSEMVLRDGTSNLAHFGANAILGVSLAVSKAAADSLKIPYYRYISQIFSQIHPNSAHSMSLPRPMFNVLNGGAHTDWQSTDIQEFMIVPLIHDRFSEQLRWCSEVYHCLAEVLKEKGHQTTTGDEGGFAPRVRSDDEAVEFLLKAIERAGYHPGRDIGIALDPASSQFWQKDHYELKIQKKKLGSEEMIAFWQTWIEQYPIISLEDGLAEDDWTGWQHLNRQLGGHMQIVGDDLLVTNIDRIKKAIDLRACNTLLMKVNQIGTLTESLLAINLAQSAGWNVVVSHRSGETEDTSIADIVVGTGAGQIKAGAPAHSERVAKYNQLLRIEEELLRSG
jgi:enolase